MAGPDRRRETAPGSRLLAAGTLSVGGTRPRFGEWAAIEQGERDGYEEQEGFVERPRDREQAESREPPERLRDTGVRCSGPDCANGMSEESQRRPHDLRVGASGLRYAVSPSCSRAIDRAGVPGLLVLVESVDASVKAFEVAVGVVGLDRERRDTDPSSRRTGPAQKTTPCQVMP